MAYVPDYTSSDMASVVIDSIVTFVVGIKDFIGILALAIAIGLVVVQFKKTGLKLG